MKDQIRIFSIETISSWFLGITWISPLLYAFWAAFHPQEYSTNFDLTAPIVLDNFIEAWSYAPFSRYFLNTFLIVTFILLVQFVICTLAAYAFARFKFRKQNFVLSHTHSINGGPGSSHRRKLQNHVST